MINFDFKVGDLIWLTENGEKTPVAVKMNDWDLLYIKYKGEDIRLPEQRFTKEQRQQFADMSAKQNFKPFSRLSEVLPTVSAENDLQIGDTVIFTNDYGANFIHNVLGFDTPATWGGCVHLDWDCYWHMARPDHLRKINIIKED